MTTRMLEELARWRECQRIMAMTDEEIIADCYARGTTPEAEAALSRQAFDYALASVGWCRPEWPHMS